MNWLVNQLAEMRLIQGDFDYKLVRASMVIIYFFFGYQKWFDYEAKELIPFFTRQWRPSFRYLAPHLEALGKRRT